MSTAALLRNFTPLHVHFLEHYLADCFGQIAQDMWGGGFKRAGIDISTDQFWVEFVGMTVLEALCLATLVNPHADLLLGSGTSALSEDAAEYRRVVYDGVRTAVKDDNIPGLVVSVATQCQWELSDLSRFNDAYHLAQNLLSGALFFIARTSGQQEQIESLQLSAMSAEFQNLEESNTFFMTGSPLPGHQPLGLRYPANGKNRLFHMVNRRRLLRGKSRDQGRAVTVAVVEPWESHVGQVTPVATILDDDQNHWGLTAPASWIDANGADPDEWRNPTTAYLMSSGLLMGDGWQSPVNPLDDPS
jgi:hypothetical protein